VASAVPDKILAASLLNFSPHLQSVLAASKFDL